MTTQIYNQRIVVYDHDNMGILCVSPSDEIASIICMGLLNSRWLSISRHNEFFNTYKDINFDDLSSNYQISLSEKGVSIFLMEDRLSNEEWKEKRKLTLEKRKLITSWEWLCRTSVSRVNTYYGWPTLLPFLVKELSKCNIKEEIYTQSIIEWSNIQEVTPAAAVRELEMQVDGIGLAYMKNFAFYDKFARQITMSSSLTELHANFKVALENRRRGLN